jgi:hypothetical protein
MQAQVSSESIPVVIKNCPQKTESKIKSKPISKNYLDLKNQICKDTFHIGC